MPRNTYSLVNAHASVKAVAHIQCSLHGVLGEIGADQGRGVWLSLESFPRGFPTGLSHVSRWCESILGVKVEAVQGKQDPLDRTEISGGLLEWWHDP